MQLSPIAYYRGQFGGKFGIPKQAGLVESSRGRIIMQPRYRDMDFFRGIEGFSHLWLLWGFSANQHAAESPLVRPPLLGGNEKVGVFASRSPYRPNPIGLSAVELCRVEWQTELGVVLVVGGADLMDGTPIYDIKPYVPIADIRSEARGGFTDTHPISYLTVELDESLLNSLTSDEASTLRGALALDPRPHYQHSSSREYRFDFAGKAIAFHVEDSTIYASLSISNSQK